MGKTEDWCVKPRSSIMTKILYSKILHGNRSTGIVMWPERLVYGCHCFYLTDWCLTVCYNITGGGVHVCLWLIPLDFCTSLRASGSN